MSKTSNLLTGEATPAVLHSRPPRQHHLDGLRALAALMVFVNHCFQQVYWQRDGFGIIGRLSPWLQLGHYAVTLFIVLSGFCLMLPVLSHGSLRGGARNFYVSRAKRILPAYWAAILISLLLILTLVGGARGTMFDYSASPSWLGIVGHVLLINNLMPMPWYGQVNSVFWSVALEWQIYFWFPVFLLLWKRVGPFYGMGIITLAAWVVYWQCQHQGVHRIAWTGIYPEYYAFFAMGMLAATIGQTPAQERLRRSVPWGWLTAAMAVGFIVLYQHQSHGWQQITIEDLDIYCSIFFLSLLVTVSSENLLQRVFSWRPLVRIGEYSYSVYLLHLPLIAVLTDYLILPLRRHGVGDQRLFLLLLVTSFPLVLFVSSRFALIFENKRVINGVLERVGLKSSSVAL